MDRDKMSNLYRGPSIDVSYQVSVHLAEGFQRRRLKCEKLRDDRRQMPSEKNTDLICKFLQLPTSSVNISRHLLKAEGFLTGQFIITAPPTSEYGCHIAGKMLKEM